MDKKDSASVLDIMTQSLKREVLLTEKDSRDSVEEWDSFGHILILTSLDKSFEGKLASVKDLAGAKSVKDILNILAREGCI